MHGGKHQRYIHAHVQVGLCYLWFPEITLHFNIYGSLLVVVFVTMAVFYLVLPLNMYVQMVQNVCF